MAKEARILSNMTLDHIIIKLFPFSQKSRHFNSIISTKNGNSGKKNYDIGGKEKGSF